MQNKRVQAAHLNAASVRQHNRRILLQLLRTYGDLSRRQLSERSGLSAPAVTNVVAELLDSGLVVDVTPGPESGLPKLGRPSSNVALVSRSHFVLSAQIGAGVLQVGVVDLTGEVLASELIDFSLPAQPEDVMALAVEMLRRVMETAHVTTAQVRGLGVGAAGLVDDDQRVNLSSQNLGWSEVHMADYFEDALGVEVVVDHNVRAMAVGEARYGAGQGLESLVFVYSRTGVGAGLILGGREYRGGTHGAAEIGHMRVVPNGVHCNCGGRGCLETVVSDVAVKARMLSAGLISASPDRNDHAWSQQLVDLVVEGDSRAIAIRDEIVEYVTSALLNIINLLNPQLIVLGGLLNDLSPVLIDELRASIPIQVLPLLRDTIRIQPAHFGADAGMIGAATVALDQFVFGTPLLTTTRSH